MREIDGLDCNELIELAANDARELRRVSFLPHASAAFIDQYCQLLSDESGEVYARIENENGRARVELRRIPSAKFLPALLRRQSGG